MSATANETSAAANSLLADSMKRGATSTPWACPPGADSSAIRAVVSPKPQPTSSAFAPGGGGNSSSAFSPWFASPPTMTSRYSTNRSKSGPSQASVAAALAFVAISAPTLFDAEAVKQAFVAAPALAHAHAQVEEHAPAQQGLHLLARATADVA